MALSARVTVLYLLGLVLAGLSFGLLDQNPLKFTSTLTVVSLLLIGAALVARIALAVRAPELRPHALLTLCGTLGVLAGMWLNAYEGRLTFTSPTLSLALTELSAAALLIGVIPIVAYEMSAWRAPMEPRRNTLALRRGLGVSFLFIFIASAQYSLSQRSVSADYTTKREPSSATRRLASSLDAPLEVVLFFPPLSEVGNAVERYFANLKREAPSVTVTRVDPALEPRRARAFGLSADGAIGLRLGERRVVVQIPLHGSEARALVRRLDREVYRHIAALTESPRAVYFTAGHGEPPLEGPRATTTTLQSYLQALHFGIRPLSAAEGLTQQVPEDAAAVFIIGPRREFLKVERAALAAYAARGGRILLAVEPDTDVDALLEPFGVQAAPGIVTQERGNVSLSARPSLADRQTFLVRGESQTALGPLDVQVLVAGARALLPRVAKGVLTTGLVYSSPEAWLDQDRDYLFTQAKEAPRGRQTLAVAVEGPGAARAIILGDADMLSDKSLAYAAGNEDFAAAALRWLFEQSDKSATQFADEDRPILRRRGVERAWTLALPLAFLVAGLFMGRKRGRP